MRDRALSLGATGRGRRHRGEDRRSAPRRLQGLAEDRSSRLPARGRPHVARLVDPFPRPRPRAACGQAPHCGVAVPREPIPEAPGVRVVAVQEDDRNPRRVRRRSVRPLQRGEGRVDPISALSRSARDQEPDAPRLRRSRRRPGVGRRGARRRVRISSGDDSPVHILQELAGRVHGAVAAAPSSLIAEDERNERRLVLPRERGRLRAGRRLGGRPPPPAAPRLRGRQRGLLPPTTRGSAEDIARTLRQGWFYEGQLSQHRGQPRGTPADGLPPAALRALHPEPRPGGQPRPRRPAGRRTCRPRPTAP